MKTLDEKCDMPEKLKRCGCGGEAEIIKHTFHKLSPSYGIECTNCHTESWQFYDTEAEAVTAWNRAMGERTAKVDGDWGLAMCCACKKRVFPLEKYCPSCGARLEWK